jgi:hypothetical protein
MLSEQARSGIDQLLPRGGRLLGALVRALED